MHLVNPEDAVNTAKHCMVPGNQKGQRVLQEFVKTSETNTNNTGIDNELDPHKMHTFEYTQDYLFFNKQTKVINKEIVVEEKFAFFLENSKKMALIRHVDKEVTLRRVLKKTQFNADAPEERIQNLKIRTRKAYTKEAEIKRKKLHRYERNLVSKYGITDFIEEPKEPEWEEEYLDEEQAGMDQEDLPDRHRDYRPQQGGQHQHQHQQSRPMGNNKKVLGLLVETNRITAGRKRGIRLGWTTMTASSITATAWKTSMTGIGIGTGTVILAAAAGQAATSAVMIVQLAPTGAMILI